MLYLLLLQLPIPLNLFFVVVDVVVVVVVVVAVAVVILWWRWSEHVVRYDLESIISSESELRWPKMKLLITLLCTLKYIWTILCMCLCHHLLPSLKRREGKKRSYHPVPTIFFCCCLFFCFEPIKFKRCTVIYMSTTL